MYTTLYSVVDFNINSVKYNYVNIGCNGYIDEIDIKLHQYYANVFIGNNDFAKVNVGDNVRIEIT